MRSGGVGRHLQTAWATTRSDRHGRQRCKSIPVRLVFVALRGAAQVHEPGIKIGFIDGSMYLLKEVLHIFGVDFATASGNPEVDKVDPEERLHMREVGIEHAQLDSEVTLAKLDQLGLDHDLLHELCRPEIGDLTLADDPTCTCGEGEVINVQAIVFQDLIFAGIDKVINVARVVEVIERVAILKSDGGHAFQNFGELCSVGNHNFILY